MMIDSCNLIVKEVPYLDFKHLNQNKMYPKPHIEIKKNGFIQHWYKFKYKGMTCNYNCNEKYLIIQANAHKILNKRDITLSDLTEYELRINKTVKLITKLTNPKIELNRIDYYVDIPLNDKLMFYIELLKYLPSKYKHLKIKKFYSTSQYLKTNYGQTNMNLYDRYARYKKKKDKGILRMEIQCRPKKIKTELKRHGVCKEVQEYWNIVSMEEYYFKFLSGYIYNGDYYKKEVAYKIINNSDYSKTIKKNLKQFLRDVSKLRI